MSAPLDGASVSATARGRVMPLTSRLSGQLGVAERQSDATISFQAECERSTWQFVPMAFEKPEQSDAAVRRCARKLEVRRYYEPLHHLPAFAHLEVGDGRCPRSDDLWRRVLCLPMANDLSAEEIELIAGIVAAVPRRPRAGSRS